MLMYVQLTTNAIRFTDRIMQVRLLPLMSQDVSGFNVLSCQLLWCC
jgi:hypothetical protein